VTDLEKSFAYIGRTKNGKPRPVFLHKDAVAALEDLEKHPSGRVFGFAKGGHLYHLLKAAAFKAGVNFDPRSAFHSFRHTWGTMMYPHLGVKGLVDTGRWDDPKSAERYIHTNTSEAAQKVTLLPSRVVALLPTPRKESA
jgi:integrase